MVPRFARRGSQYQARFRASRDPGPEWSELLLTAAETGLTIQASLQDGRVYVHMIWPDGRTTIYESTLVGNVLTAEELL
jgi:hypothetical protein